MKKKKNLMLYVVDNHAPLHATNFAKKGRFTCDFKCRQEP